MMCAFFFIVRRGEAKTAPHSVVFLPFTVAEPSGHCRCSWMPI